MTILINATCEYHRDSPGWDSCSDSFQGNCAYEHERRRVEALRTNARLILEHLRIGQGQDFHTLNREQVAGLIAEADRVRYQKPAHSNGSRARYFHDRLQRAALRNRQPRTAPHLSGIDAAQWFRGYDTAQAFGEKGEEKAKRKKVEKSS